MQLMSENNHTNYSLWEMLYNSLPIKYDSLFLAIGSGGVEKRQ